MKKIETAKEITNILDDICKRFGVRMFKESYFSYEEASDNDLKYGIKGDFKQLYNIGDTHISNAGIRKQKRLKRYCNKYISKKSLNTANRLLWLLTKQILEIDRVSIGEPKHDLIQKKRKEWIKLRDAAEVALKDYKNEKGDYYKLKEPTRELQLN